MLTELLKPAVNPDNSPIPPSLSPEQTLAKKDNVNAPSSSEVASEELRKLRQNHDDLRFQYEGINRLLEAQSKEFQAVIEERDQVLNLNKEYANRIRELDLRIQTLLREIRSNEELNRALNEQKEQVEALSKRLVNEQEARRQAELALTQAGERLKRYQQQTSSSVPAPADPAKAVKEPPLTLTPHSPSSNLVSNLAPRGTGAVSHTLKKTIGSMSELVPKLLQRTQAPGVLPDLCRLFGVLNRETAQIGILPLHQLATALQVVTEDFQKSPTLMIPSRLRTVGQAFELLTTLCQKETLPKLKGFTPPNILAVDDDTELLSIVENELGSLGMSLCSLRNSGQVLAALQSQQFNLLLLDIGMAGFNGLELCTRIRRLEGYARTPIIFISGMTTTELRDQSLAVGGSDFVGKPFHAAELGLKAVLWGIRDQILS